ncbi:MAG: hypothetical protein PHO02_02625 [Candidatus Nanoarchaeia archaeon]|nr:hypothetical protein [Candidatus Nanoarchaeia archaeon]
MKEYDLLETEIKAYEKYKTVNTILSSLYGLATPVLAFTGITNFSEDGNQAKAIVCTLAALYTAYRAVKGVKRQKGIKNTLAELHEEKRMSLEKKLE